MSELLCFATIPAAFFGWMFWSSFQVKVARCSHGKIGARQNRNLCDECKTAHDAEVESLRITSQAEQERATIQRKAIEERNLVPCKHGTVGGFRKRKLCDQRGRSHDENAKRRASRLDRDLQCHRVSGLLELILCTAKHLIVLFGAQPFRRSSLEQPSHQ